MNKKIKIGDRFIGPDYPPFIVAEMSGNHNQSLERALRIVEAAAKAGVHAVKLQTYTADTLTIDADTEDFIVKDANQSWDGQSLYALYQKASTPWEWHEPVYERCRKLGVIPFSAPFDETAVDFLEKLDTPAYKIASFENNHLPLIRKVASTGKPIIVSTGMATLTELDELVEIIKKAGCKDLILLKCTSTYPSTPEDTNLLTIPDLRERYNLPVGLSDHTLGIGVSVASIALGAIIIEKHFTLSRSGGGVDAAFSMEPNEMAMLVEETKRAWQALGEVHYGTTQKEQASTKFRRSIFAVEDIKAGETFTNHNIRIIRPGSGLHPRYYDSLIGEQASCDIKRGLPMKWEYKKGR